MTYDQWKTTPPDYMCEEPPLSPEQEAIERWLDDMDDDGWLEAIDNALRAASGQEVPAGNRLTVWGPAQP